MTESMATGWFYLPSGAPPDRKVGPLTWNELWAVRCSGSLQPADLVWHQTMTEWTPAAEVQGLFPAAAAPPAYQAAAYEQGAHQSVSRGNSSILAWLIPLIVLVIVGGGVGSYFGFFYNKDDTGGTSSTTQTMPAVAGQTTATTESEVEGVTGDFDLNGTWVGTWTFTSIERSGGQGEEENVNEPLPLTMEVEMDESGTGTADCAIDEGESGLYKTHVDFIYANGKLECVGWDYDVEGIPCTAKVTQKGGQLVWEGTFDYVDLGNLKYEAVWTVTKRPVTR